MILGDSPMGSAPISIYPPTPTSVFLWISQRCHQSPVELEQQNPGRQARGGGISDTEERRDKMPGVKERW